MTEITEVPALPRVKTGPDARRSQFDRAIRAADKSYDEEAFFPVAGRGARRQAKRAQDRQAKRGRKLYVRRELAKERAASDLANLFLLLDGPFRPAQVRAREAIEARVEYLATERARANPDEDFTDAEIVQQLRTIAATAKLPAPKVKSA